MVREHVLNALLENFRDEANQSLLKGLKEDDDLELSNFELTSLRLVEISMSLEESLGIEL